jgi:hypothetical protein
MPLIYPILKKQEPRTSASAGGTSVYALPDAGKISSLYLVVTASCVSGGTNAAENAKLVERYTKIEVIADGSRELHVYTGPVAQAMQFYDNGRTPVDKVLEYATGMQRAIIPIHFGRKVMDPDLALTLENYESVEVRFTNDITSSVFTGLAENLYYVKAAGDVGAFGAKGVLRKREWAKWTTVADEWKYWDLPEEELLRRIVLQANPDKTSNKADCDFRDLMYDLEYKSRSGDIELIDANLEQLLWWNALEYGYELITGGEAYRTADDSFEAGLGMQLAHGAFSSSADGSGSSTVPTRSRDDDNTILMESYEADSPVSWLTKGVGIWNTAVIRHDRMADLSDLLSLSDFKTVELNIHTRNSASAADGTNRIVLETVVPK